MAMVLQGDAAVPNREKLVVRALSMQANIIAEIESQISSLSGSLSGVLRLVPEEAINKAPKVGGPPLIAAIEEHTEKLARQLQRLRDIEQRLEV